MLKRYILVLFTCLLPILSYADDTVYHGDGTDIYPLGSNSIQLVAETIVITDRYGTESSDKGKRFLVEVDMIFKNHGPNTSVQFGFPVLFWDDNADGLGRVDIDSDFQTWVNNIEVKTVKKKGVPNPVKFYNFSDAVFAYPVTFKAQEVKKIRHRYTVGGTANSIGEWEVEYVLRTGALWKGVIEDFKLIYKTNLKAAPETFGPLPREQKVEAVNNEIVFRWELKNFKPKKDFVVVGRSSKFQTDIESISHAEAWQIKRRTSAETRYLKNIIFAHYGYPFKNPFIRAQFYYPESPYKEDPSYSEKKISKEHMELINMLTKQEEEKVKAEAW